MQIRRELNAVIQSPGGSCAPFDRICRNKMQHASSIARDHSTAVLPGGSSRALPSSRTTASLYFIVSDFGALLFLAFFFEVFFGGGFVVSAWARTIC
jgi:hypothetical protein